MANLNQIKSNLLQGLLYFVASTCTIALIYMLYFIISTFAYDGMLIELIQLIYFLLVAFFVAIISTLIVLYFNTNK